MDPKVIISCVTYNHEKYIGQALQSFVMQKTSFPFVVHVHDDLSTDNTRKIIEEYQKKYPEIIIPKFHKENCYSQGADVLQRQLYSDLTSEYVCFCEGDDYWTDEYKLDKQITFLDSHKDFAVCCHLVELIWEDDKSRNSIYPYPEFCKGSTEFALEDLLKNNFFATSSVCYRWRKDFNDVFVWGIFPGDWFRHILHAETGKVKMIPEVMGVYRKHRGGIWYGHQENDSFYINNGIKFLNFYKIVGDRYQRDYSSQIHFEMFNTLIALLKSCQYERIAELREIHEEIFLTILESCKSLSSVLTENCQYKKMAEAYKQDIRSHAEKLEDCSQKLHKEIKKKRQKTWQIRLLILGLAAALGIICYLILK